MPVLRGTPGNSARMRLCLLTRCSEKMASWPIPSCTKRCSGLSPFSAFPAPAVAPNFFRSPLNGSHASGHALANRFTWCGRLWFAVAAEVCR